VHGLFTRRWEAVVVNEPVLDRRLPSPTQLAGTDLLPQIEHIVVLMKENHTFDNYFGMLGRGDGFTLDVHGQPVNSNPDAAGRLVTVHHLTSPWQPWHGLDQHWNASHLQWNHGANDGFVRTTNSSLPMGYWTAEDLPFYYGLARTFPIGDRYFASCLAQTFPNRRFLQAGTASGLVATRLPNPFEPNPPTGTVWDELDRHQISWVNYFVELPEIGLYPRVWIDHPSNAHPIAAFYQDCRLGRLPAISLITPDLFVISEGETQDVQAGEAFTASVVDAVLHSPSWPRTMLIVVYDEGGGYYDHVPPLGRCARRRSPGDPRPTRSTRRLRPARFPGALHRRRAVRQSGARLARCLRPHLHPQNHSTQVEPAPADPPGRGRRRPARLPRPHRGTGVPATATPAAPRAAPTLTATDRPPRPRQPGNPQHRTGPVEHLRRPTHSPQLPPPTHPAMHTGLSTVAQTDRPTVHR